MKEKKMNFILFFLIFVIWFDKKLKQLTLCPENYLFGPIHMYTKYLKYKIHVGYIENMFWK